MKANARGGFASDSTLVNTYTGKGGDPAETLTPVAPKPPEQRPPSTPDLYVLLHSAETYRDPEPDDEGDDAHKEGIRRTARILDHYKGIRLHAQASKVLGIEPERLRGVAEQTLRALRVQVVTSHEAPLLDINVIGKRQGRIVVYGICLEVRYPGAIFGGGGHPYFARASLLRSCTLSLSGLQQPERVLADVRRMLRGFLRELTS